MVAFMAASVLAAAAATVPAMYVFGDSLADVGNNNYLVTLLKADFSHNGMDYPGGQGHRPLQQRQELGRHPWCTLLILS
jgi:hypothetical protein